MSGLERRPKIVIVGAGVSGLTCAYLLRETGRQRKIDCAITLLEVKNRHGGNTRTEYVDGYLCEWGANGFLDNEPTTLELVKRLGLTDRLIGASRSADRRFIYHSGRMHEVPLSPRKFMTSDILPFTAKLRMAMELVIPPKCDNDDDETIHSFGRRRLGKSFAAYLLDPMVSGIFAGNIRELSLAATFPKMVELERCYGGLFRALLKRRGENKNGPAGPAGRLHTFRKGMGELTDALAARLEESIKTDCEAISLKWANHRFQIHHRQGSLDADGVILACPSYEAARIIGDLSHDVSSKIRDIPFAWVDVVCHAHQRTDVSHPLDGFGVLIPRNQSIRSLGTLWCDSIFPGQAPANHHLLRTILGGACDPDIGRLSIEQLHDQAHDDHRRLMHVSGKPCFKREFRHPKGIAQYTVGHQTRVAATEQLEKDMPLLFFTGASYRGISINACVKDAYRITDAFWDKWSSAS